MTLLRNTLYVGILLASSMIPTAQEQNMAYRLGNWLKTQFHNNRKTVALIILMAGLPITIKGYQRSMAKLHAHTQAVMDASQTRDATCRAALLAWRAQDDAQEQAEVAKARGEISQELEQKLNTAEQKVNIARVADLAAARRLVRIMRGR